MDGLGTSINLKYRYENMISRKRQREMQQEQNALESSRRFIQWNYFAKQHDLWNSSGYFQMKNQQYVEGMSRKKKEDLLSNRRSKLRVLLQSENQVYQKELEKIKLCKHRNGFEMNTTLTTLQTRSPWNNHDYRIRKMDWYFS